MSVYLDTSVLVPIFVDESRSEDIRLWFRSAFATTIVSDFAALEFSAVMSRAVRTGALSELRAREILVDFDALRQACIALAHGPDDVALAQRLIRDFSTKLAAPDALNLATTMNLGAALSTFDDRLAAAAASNGVQVATAFRS